MTAAAALKMMDQGGLQLDAPALPHMDALVRKVTSRSLMDYFGPKVGDVTPRHLLHMTSGIGDFDSKAMRSSIFEQPGEEFDMHKVLTDHLQGGSRDRIEAGLPDSGDSFTCMPGSCGHYSSTNYLLLGMMLAQAHGLAHWKQYDQSSFLPPDVRRKMPSTVFPLQGLLREFTDVHVYP